VKLPDRNSSRGPLGCDAM